MLTAACIPAQASETTFDDILNRVSQRHPITNAILSIDNGLLFKLEIKDDLSEVTIWKHMKVHDPARETYYFVVSDVIRQEYARLDFQIELNDLASRCVDSERRFRISQYKKHPIYAGMPYREAKNLLKDEFKPDGLPRSALGAYRLESNTHSMVFRGGTLIDVIARKSSNKPDAGDGK